MSLPVSITDEAGDSKNTNSRSSWRRMAIIGVIVCALSVHLFMLSLAMPAESWRLESWFFHIDHPYHEYQLELGRALLREGRWEGYDPFFGGGALGGCSPTVPRFSTTCPGCTGLRAAAAVR